VSGHPDISLDIVVWLVYTVGEGNPANHLGCTKTLSKIIGINIANSTGYIARFLFTINKSDMFPPIYLEDHPT